MNTVILGRLGKPYGVRGWIHVTSFTQPIQNLLNYTNWQVGEGSIWAPRSLKRGKLHNNHLVVQLAEITDCDIARTYTNKLIAVDRNELPALNPGEHYWHDLIGMRVINTEHQDLGTFDHFFDTGANLVLVIKDEDHKEHLLPDIPEVILDIDASKKIITVDWDPNF